MSLPVFCEQSNQTTISLAQIFISVSKQTQIYTKIKTTAR